MSEAQPQVAPATPATAPTAPAAPAEGEEQPVQNTAEQAPATAPEGEKPEITPEQAAKREGRRFERRLDKAYRKAAEAAAERDFYRKQLEELKQPKATDTGVPRLEQFDDIEKYAEAYAKFEAERAVKDHQAKQQTESQKQAQARLVEAWESRTAKADAKYEDFDEVVGDLKPTTPWAMAVMEAENGEDIAYYLGKNPGEARRIFALPPVSQIREIGRLEAKLAAEPPKPKTPSRAPAPITPLTGAATLATDTPSENDDIGAWIKKRQKQVYGKRR